MQANSEVTDRGGTSRVAFPPVEVDDEIPTPTRQFAVDEITSGLPDDSREEDERQEERRLRDLRGRVRAATYC